MINNNLILVPLSHYRKWLIPFQDEKTLNFIDEARKVHGNRYDYSKTFFTRLQDKIYIICPEHGEFWQKAGEHLRGAGCKFCGLINMANRRRKSKEDFIKEAIEIHGPEKYNYDKVIYVNNSTKVEIYCNTCKKYFWQAPQHHLRGRGCPECAHREHSIKISLTTEEFIKKAIEIHGSEKYNYDRVNYIDYNTKVEIYCNTCKKYFWQSPGTHLKGYGCHDCGLKKMSETKTKTTEEFIRQAIEIHGDDYNYNESEYLGVRIPIKIYCNTCKEYFWQTPAHHLQGHSCPKCSNKEHSIKMSLTTEEFIKRSKDIFGENKFDYSLVNYINLETPVDLICNDCGVKFSQRPDSHLSGSFGCNCKAYHGEMIVDKWLKLKNFTYKAKYTTNIIKVKQSIIIDFRLIYNNKEYWIEYNGRQHYGYVEYFFKTWDIFMEQLKRDSKVREYCKCNSIILIEIPYTLHNEKSIFDFLDKIICLGINPNSLIDYESLFEDIE